jgi:hypothetical protein
VPVGSVDPLLVVPTGLCPDSVLVARTTNGVEIARRQPTGDCREEPWIIRCRARPPAPTRTQAPW